MILNEEGCTVKLWKYEKTYKWDEITIKRWEKKYEWSYFESAFFSVYPVEKPINIEPFNYCVYRHPFTCFCVNFWSESYRKSYQRSPEYCTLRSMSKEEFVQQLQEWGVEFEIVEPLK